MAEHLNTILITGFLGAGKTTFLNQMLNELRSRPERTCLLINEFGKIGIDGSLISAGPETIHEINAGSIFCVCTRDQFLKALDNTASAPEPFDLLLIEATGIASTSDLGSYLYGPPLNGRIKVKKNFCLVDAINFHKIKTTLPAAINQVEEATTLVINKTDLTNEEKTSELKHELHQLNPRADIQISSFGKIDFTKALGDISDAGDWLSNKSLAKIPPKDLSSASMKTEGIIDEKKFEKFISDLPPDILRGKGTLNIENSIQHYEWVIDNWQMKEFKKPIKESTLVLIGKNLDEKILQAKFSACVKR